MLRTPSIAGILIVVVLALATLAFTGCGGGNDTAGGVYTPPKFYAQMARVASGGGWAQLPVTNDVVTAPVGCTVRVFVDSGTVNTLTVRNPATGKDEPYVAGTQVSWPAGTWVFHANVTKQDKTSDLVYTLRITPTEFISIRHVDAYQGHTRIVPVTIPSTPGNPDLAQYYPLYHPAGGRYIAKASFLYEGETIQVLPLYFWVGPS